jgi:O-antigen/teichoic acid export membrane protein
MKVPLRNILAILTGDAGSRVIGFLVTVYLARILLPASFGLMSIGLAVLGYLSLLNSPGIQILEARNAAATEGGLRTRVGAILSFRVLLTPFLIALAWGVLAAGGVDSVTKDIILLYGLSLLPMALSLDWLFQGKEDFRVLTVSRLLNALVFAGCAFVLVRADEDVRLTAVAFLAGNVAAVAYLWARYTRRFGAPPLGWDLTAWKGILRDNAPVGAAVLLTQSVTNLPPIAIGIFLTNADAGAYSAAMKLAFVVLIIDRTLNAFFLPMATRYAVSRTEEYPELLGVSVKAVVVSLIPLLISACIAAGPAVRLIFGPGYDAAVPLFRLLTGYIFVTMLNSLFVCTLMAFARTKEYAMVVGAGAIVIFTAVLLLTALAGTSGAAWGVILGESLILLMLIRTTARVTKIPADPGLLKAGIAGALMATAAVLMEGVHPLVVLIAANAVYLGVLAATGGIPHAEIRFLKERLV